MEAILVVLYGQHRVFVALIHYLIVNDRVSYRIYLLFGRAHTAFQRNHWFREVNLFHHTGIIINIGSSLSIINNSIVSNIT